MGLQQLLYRLPVIRSSTHSRLNLMRTMGVSTVQNMLRGALYFSAVAILFAVARIGLCQEPAHTEPPLAIAPFDAATARRYQDAWAQFLRQPRTVTNSIGMKFVLVPPGEFVMGSPETEKEGGEGPQHSVRITKAFYLSAFLGTQQEFRRVMGTNPSFFSAQGEGRQDVVGMDTRRLPVECVSWDDAAAFCRKLSMLPEESGVGRVYRLPTEAEWEYACRAGTTTPFHFGKILRGVEANCNGRFPYGTAEKGPYLGRTTAVGSYAPNSFGLYDMHGNVCQWCADWYDVYDSSSRDEPINDPRGPRTGSDRVFRSGGWDSEAARCRSAARGFGVPWYGDPLSGFRVVMEAESHN